MLLNETNIQSNYSYESKLAIISSVSDNIQMLFYYTFLTIYAYSCVFAHSN